jgi:ABC-type Fe3+/spermidine/putrescine transport system ATPase subunit
MPFLSVVDIGKRFSEVPAIKSLSLDVEKGEVFGLLGPSGCGKTTVLRIIAGLETPDEGRVLLDSVDITDRRPEQRRFGVVFQSYALFPHLNVSENVSYGLRAQKYEKNDTLGRVGRALELVQLPGFERRRINELSGGEQQRVAIARAISIEPSLLLMDEPLSNLDVALRERTRMELRDLFSRLGSTVIYVTHDQDDAFALCDRVGIMGNGTIVQTGAPTEIYNNPALTSVARFLGRNNLIKAYRTSPMKQANATFRTTDGQHTLNLEVGLKQLAPIDRPVTITIRPEHVVVGSGAADEASEDHNIFSAKLRELRFTSGSYDAIFDAGGLAIEARILNRDGMESGKTYSIELPARYLKLLND